MVTNIDPEHLDHYGDFEAVKKAFTDFVENIPFYGFAAVCLDHPEVQALAARVQNRRLVTYGTSPQAEVRAVRIAMGPDGADFDVKISPREGEALAWNGLKLPMTGAHNVLNACAALAVARELGLGEAAIRAGLAAFGGVKRRFTTTGVAHGVRVVDDYGHHPVEIAAVLKAAREVQSGGEGRVVAVVQPHRYTRLRDLFAEFSAAFHDADTVIVADVYAAGEPPLEGADRDALVEGLRRYGHRRVLPLESVPALPRLVREETAPGDLVVCLGAGDITAWGLRFAGAVGGVGVSSSDGSSPIAGVSAALRKAISGLPFPQDEAGYALHAYDLVFPELTQYRGGVFRIERFDAANVDTWFGEMNWRRSKRLKLW